MDAGERDSTREWLLPEEARPPTIAQLMRGIEEALATARASEAAVMTVGAAALDAAEQARRAAELAERASASLLAAGRDREVAKPPPERHELDADLGDFGARADRLVARLRQLQRIPLPANGPSGVSAR